MDTTDNTTRCKECGTAIPDRQDACPACGCPVSYYQSFLKESKHRRNIATIVFLGAVAAALAATLIARTAVQSRAQGNSQQEEIVSEDEVSLQESETFAESEAVSGTEETDEVTEEFLPEAENEELKKSAIQGGQYKVGSEVPAGEYILFCTDDTWGANYTLSKDANQEDIIISDSFSYNSICEAREGEYLELLRCVAYPYDLWMEHNELDLTRDSAVLKTGEHIEPGEYRITANDGFYSTYYAIWSNARQDRIVSSDFFEGTRYVSVQDGQILELDSCTLGDRVGPPTSNEDTETLQSEEVTTPSPTQLSTGGNYSTHTTTTTEVVKETIIETTVPSDTSDTSDNSATNNVADNQEKGSEKAEANKENEQQEINQNSTSPADQNSTSPVAYRLTNGKWGTYSYEDEGVIYLDGVIEVTNIGTTPISILEAWFDIEDLDGHLLQTEKVAHYPDYLQSGEKGYIFSRYSIELKENWNREELSLVPHLTCEATQEKNPSFSVSDTSIAITTNGADVTGRFQNNSGISYDMVSVCAIFYDEEGSCVAAGVRPYFDIGVNEQRSFEITPTYLQGWAKNSEREYSEYQVFVAGG